MIPRVCCRAPATDHSQWEMHTREHAPCGVNGERRCHTIGGASRVDLARRKQKPPEGECPADLGRRAVEELTLTVYQYPEPSLGGAPATTKPSVCAPSA
jgi:hypothetical protein